MAEQNCTGSCHLSSNYSSAHGQSLICLNIYPDSMCPVPHKACRSQWQKGCSCPRLFIVQPELKSWKTYIHYIILYYCVVQHLLDRPVCTAGKLQCVPLQLLFLRTYSKDFHDQRCEEVVVDPGGCECS